MPLAPEVRAVHTHRVSARPAEALRVEPRRKVPVLGDIDRRDPHLRWHLRKPATSPGSCGEPMAANVDSERQVSERHAGDAKIGDLSNRLG